MTFGGTRFSVPVTWSRGQGGPPFLQCASGRELGPVFRGLVSRLAWISSSAVSFFIVKALVSVVSRLRWFRFFDFLVSRLAFGLLAGAVVSCLVARVRHTATTLLN